MVLPSGYIIMASFMVCKINSETTHDRGEVTIEHTVEVMVAQSAKQKPPPLIATIRAMILF